MHKRGTTDEKTNLRYNGPDHRAATDAHFAVCAAVLCVYGGKGVDTGRGVGLLYESEQRM